MRLVLAVLSSLMIMMARPARADVVDPDSEPVPPLSHLVEPLGAEGVDVLYSHDSDAGVFGPSFGDAPRLAPLLGFEAWPGIEVDLDRFGEWLDAFEHGARGAVAAVVAHGAETRPGREEFEAIWRDADDGERVVITFAGADLAIAERVAGVLEANGYAVYLAIAAPGRETMEPEALGRLFVQADHCLTIDTASARLNRIIQFEAELLAELRRQHAWVASGDDVLPPVKRGSMDVVEALGALPMKILPGGIVLGMRPEVDAALDGATLAIEGSDYGIATGERRHVVEQVSRETRGAIRAFVAITDSHSVVDIAGGKVTLAAPLRDTRIGERMVHADRLPFEHLSVQGAQKSLIVDERIAVRRNDNERVALDVTLEVRFYRRDDDGHAVRLAALRFTMEDVTGSARLLDLAWSRRPDSRIGFDGDGIDALTDDLEQLGLDAALIALARLDGSPRAAPSP